MPIINRQRIAAYGLCLRDDQILLAHFVSPRGERRHWTMPGGGVEQGEDPYDAVVREVEEETGYAVAVDRLLGVDSRRLRVAGGGPDGTDLHHVAVYYEVHIIGGELRHEVGGSTDFVAWHPLTEVSTLERAVIIDVALELYRTRPATGHVTPIPVDGLLRF